MSQAEVSEGGGAARIVALVRSFELLGLCLGDFGGDGGGADSIVAKVRSFELWGIRLRGGGGCRSGASAALGEQGEVFANQNIFIHSVRIDGKFKSRDSKLISRGSFVIARRVGVVGGFVGGV